MIKFKHFSSSSLPKRLDNLVKKTRAFHYNWSKFYFLRKNFGYFHALGKVFPNIIRGFKKIITNLLKLKFKEVYLNILELYGLIVSIFLLKSFYRPKN